MMLGALVDAGLAPTSLKRSLKALDIQGYRLETTQVQRGPLRATKVNVKIQKGLTAPLSVARIRRL
ncbi:MAG: nickel insertion protein, partial [Nitrospirales bacterium]